MSTIKTILKYIFNRKAIKEPKKINSKTIRNFVQGHIREFGKKFNLVDEHILEQASWREDQVIKKSIECYQMGKCKYCECGLTETLLSDAPCEHGCFPEMLNKSQWIKFKKQNNIEYVNNTK